MPNQISDTLIQQSKELKESIIKYRLAGELASRIGVHRRTLHSWLNGFCRKMPIHAIKVIASYPKLKPQLKRILTDQLGDTLAETKERKTVSSAIQLKALLAEDKKGQVIEIKLSDE